MLKFVPGLKLSPEQKALNLSMSEDFRAFNPMIAAPSGAANWATKLNLIVRDQGDCGDCVAFATIAAVEAVLQAHRYQIKDLSEAFLFAHGGSCENGWLPKPALRVMRDLGCVDELIDPYAIPIPRLTPAMNTAPKTKILSFTQLLRNTIMKLWLDQYGPVVTGMEVYSDFMDYKGGVYRAQSYEDLGGHCIPIVGYNDHDPANKYWIIKNSWGPAWGENASGVKTENANGYARIGQDQEIGLAFGCFGISV